MCVKASDDGKASDGANFALLIWCSLLKKKKIFRPLIVSHQLTAIMYNGIIVNNMFIAVVTDIMSLSQVERWHNPSTYYHS